MKFTKFKYIVPSLVMTLTLAACGKAGKPSSSSTKAIAATQVGAETAFVDLLSYDSKDGANRFFLTIGKNLHVVSDCSDEKGLFSTIETEVSKLVPSVLDTWLTDEKGYVRRSDLSCDATKLPRTPTGDILPRTMYFDAGKYYFATGANQEYYAIDVENSACVFNLASGLFGFESRSSDVVYAQPSDLAQSKVTTLSCQNRASGVYRLLKFSQESFVIKTNPPGAEAPGRLKRMYVLSYSDRQSDGQTATTYLPFYKVDGKLLEDGSAESTKLLNLLNQKFGVNITDVPLLDRLLFTKEIVTLPWDDFCIDRCGEAGLKPNHLILDTKTVTFSPVTALEASSLSDKKGQVFSHWSQSKTQAINFYGCDDSFIKGFGLSAKENEWFSTQRLLSQGQLDVSGKLFVCPRLATPKTCDVVLTKNSYSADEIIGMIKTPPATCAGRDTFRLRMDANVRILLNKEISFDSSVASNFKKLTIEAYEKSLRRTLTIAYTCADKGDCLNTNLRKIFRLGFEKEMEINGIDIKVAVDTKKLLADNEEELTRFQAFYVEQDAKLSFLRVHLLESKSSKGTRNLLTQAVSVESKVSTGGGCFGCVSHDEIKPSLISVLGSSIDTEEESIIASNSRVLVQALNEEPSLIRSKKKPLSLLESGEAVVEGSKMVGSPLTYIGEKARVFFKNMQFSIAGSTLSNSVSAFEFGSAEVAKPFSLEVDASDFHDLPPEQISNFRFADFRTATAAAVASLNGTRFFRVDDGKEVEIKPENADLYLSCGGTGKLLFRFKNYCAN